ncbi:MAG TPA: hypothetical protein VFC07_09120 [Verrucomicrobiae bacterium]|nr:hypothetical protein [Verrucomicrobiae bacterium]
MSSNTATEAPNLRRPPTTPASSADSGVRRSFKLLLASNYWLFIKWSFMACTLVWLMIYWLSEASEKLPDFVYVNF